MSFCLGWQNAFDAVGMHGRRWFSDMIPMRIGQRFINDASLGT